jgi:hypothetical protein
MVYTEEVGSSCGASYLYSEGARFESRLGTDYPEVYCGFPGTHQVHARIVPLLGQDLFLPNPFPFISCLSSFSSMLYSCRY